MTLKYWTNFSKRKNSTKQPTGGTSVTCQLKEGTSIEKPVFLLTGDLFTCNYIEAFGHYYFVDDVKSVRNGLTEVSCSMDVLATFKTDIGSYNALIERSASFYDAKYPDPSVSIKNDEVVNDVASSVSFFSKTGCYAVSVLNDSGFGGTGFTTTYIMSETNCVILSNYINTNWGSAATDFLDWVQATFLHTADSIISCVWLPISYSSVSGSEYQVRVGVDNIPSCWGKPLSDTNIASSSAESITIPHYYPAGDFRRGAPYTQCKLFIPMYGCIDVNPMDFASGVIKMGFYMDMSTGDCLCVITDGSDEMVTTVRYNAGISCPVGRVASDVSGTIGGIFSTAASIGMAVQGGAYKAIHGIAAAASGINTLATAAGITPSVQGSRGGRAMTDHIAIHCITTAKMTQDPSTLSAEAGRVCMAKHAINTCSGYIKCIDASVPIAGMSGEKEEVNNYLNSGFYYE